MLTSCLLRSPEIIYSLPIGDCSSRSSVWTHNLCRHARDERPQDQVALCRREIGRAQANQIIRKQSEVFWVKAIVAEFLEKGIVTRFAVFALDFEPGDSDRLGQLDHLWQALTVGRDCIGAFFEHEGIGLADIDALFAVASRRIEPLRPQR